MKLRRVKITGIGPVTPAGIGREAFWKGIQEPVSRIRPFNRIGDEWGEFIAAWVEDDELRRACRNIEIDKHAARHSVMAVLGASLALNDAGLAPKDFEGKRYDVVTGTSIMDFAGISREIENVTKKGLRVVNPRVVAVAGLAEIAANISKSMRLRGNNMALQSSCCSSLDAIGYATKAIERGEADLVICGGTEAPLHKHPMLEFRALGLTPGTADRSRDMARPFDLWRTTGVIAEGACLFVLEAEESPRPGYCFVSGYGYATDQDGVVCSGLVASMRSAIADAQLRPDRIDVINACAPGHREVDAAECAVIRKVFRDHSAEIATCSIKGAIGHALGAAPAIQAASAALGLHEGVVVPTVNYRQRDPSCDVRVAPHSRVLAHGSCIVNAHGSSGTNASLVLTRCS